MFWWTAQPNFGDALAPVIVAWMSHGNPIRVPYGYKRKLLSVGSVLHRMQTGDWVWGTGAISDEPMERPDGVEVFAVRGPLTRAVLHGDAPEVYGDPVLLLPQFHPAMAVRHEVGIVPHLVDLEAGLPDASVNMIDVRRPWRDVVDAITACHVILSSSLHGLVVADAYGIPAVWVSITGRVKGGSFKFHDHYLGTERDPPRPVEWSYALRHIDRLTPEVPDIDVRPLVKSFPKRLRFYAGRF
jgi:pyruvyltransferase